MENDKQKTNIKIILYLPKQPLALANATPLHFYDKSLYHIDITL
jgi:hypothetical protein